MADEKKSFWETLPGIFTGAAALVTAIAGLLALFIRPGSKPAPDPTPAVQTAPEKPERPTRLPRREAPVQRIPAASETAQIGGIWNDVLEGLQVRITQDGKRFRSDTFHPVTRQRLASGTGVISGRRLTGTNTWMDGNIYSYSFKVSDEGNEITGSYRNTLTGQSGQSHFTRN